MTGKIKTLRPEKGFGFIKDDSGKDYFFHQSAIYGEGIDMLREGDSVEFTLGPVTPNPALSSHDLFDVLPPLSEAGCFDAATQSFRAAARLFGSPAGEDFPLATGAGVFLAVSAGATLPPAVMRTSPPWLPKS